MKKKNSERFTKASGGTLSHTQAAVIDYSTDPNESKAIRDKMKSRLK